MFQKNSLISICIVAVVCLFLMAAKPDGITKFTSIWIGDSTQTADVTPGVNDAYIYGTLEVDGAVRLDGTVTVASEFSGTSIVTATNIADVVRYYQLPLLSFTSYAADAISNVTASTTPGLEVGSAYPMLVWADSEVTPATITFRVPSDYVSGGAFKVLATESAASTDNQIDFDVYINSDGVAYDSAATGQTPVVIAADTTTPDEVILTVATDFASLAAGNWVTLRIWRDNTATGTADMQVRGVAFYYTATQ